jgi:N-sulfoglucosamine sulfohydrolase
LGDRRAGESIPPNIVLVICHDLGQHVGCLGANVRTPHIDSLAADGVLFTNHFCTAAQCSPSRGSILTGRFPHCNGLVGLAHLGWEVGAQEVTLPMYLGAAGYTTHLIGVQHEHSEAGRLGYQHIDTSRLDALGATENLTALLESKAQEEPSRPFFVSVGFIEPHRPYQRDGYARDDPAKVTPLPYLPDLPAIREDLAGLNGLVWRVDEAVGRICKTLERTDLAGRTVLIFTTDHGIAMPRAKGTSYDPGLKTVCIIRWPGRWCGGRRHDELISNCDLLPTVLELVGMRIPSQVQGLSFLPLLDGGDYVPREHIFAEMTWHDKYNPMRSIRTATHKYIRNFGERPLVYIPADIYVSGSGQAVREQFYGALRPQEELYDLRTDPLQMHNVIGDPANAQVAADLRRRVQEWMLETNDFLLYGDCPPTRLQRERLERRELDN